MFAFGTAAVGYSTLATEVDGVSQDLTTALHSLGDQAGGAIDDHKSLIAHVIAGSNELAASMMDTSSACERQDAYDQALSQAPTPEAVERARARARVLMQLAAAGSIDADVAWDAQDDAERLEAERNAAVKAHEAETAGTEFTVPESGEWTPWSPHGDAEGGDEKGEDEDDNTDGEWGGGGEDEDEPVDPPSDQPPSDQRQMPVTPQPSVAEPRVNNPTAVSPETEAAFNAWMADSPLPSGTTLSSADGPAPATTTTPTYATTIPQPTPVQNAPTVASPAYMQPQSPPPTGPSSLGQTRPYGTANPANHPSQQQRAAEERQTPITDTGAAAVMATQSHVVASAPMPTPAPSTAPTPATVPPLGQVTPGQTPTATGQTPAGTPPVAPVGAGVPPAAANTSTAKPQAEKRVVDLPEPLRKLMTDAEVAKFYEETGTRPPDAPADPAPNPNPHVGAAR